MKLFSLRFSSSLLSLGLLALAACESGGNKAKDSAQNDAIVHPLADSTPIMEYEGGKILAGDVNSSVAPEIKKFNEEAIEAYKRGAEHILVRRLVDAEAKKQGAANADAMMNQMAGSVQVTDDQVKKFIKENHLEKGFKDPHTGKLQKVSNDQIKGFLLEQERQTKTQGFLQELLAKAKAKSLLQEPRVDIKPDPAAASLGSSKAKVVVEEFSDFQCPYCKQAHDIPKKLIDAYGDKIYVQFRNFPLPPNMHPEAKAAAIAGACANRQGKFWQMHDKLFENQESLGEKNYSTWAKEVGLDMGKFEPCVKNGEGAKDVEKDAAAGEAIGVNSTPTFFVNGRSVRGAGRFEQFKNIIDEELAKK